MDQKCRSDGSRFISVKNLTSNPQRVPVSLVYKAIPQRVDQPKEKPEVNNEQIEFVNKVYEEINYSTDSQLTSSSEFEFLSSTDPTEEGLTDRELRKRTDPELMGLISEIESQLKEVKDLWVMRRALRWKTS